MVELIGGGLWIPFLFFAGAFFYALWILYRNLDRLRDRGRRFDEGLQNVLVQYRIAMERIKQAESLIEADQTEKAIRELQEIQRAHPSLPATDYLLGKAYRTKGEPSQARVHLERFLEYARPHDAVSKERIEEARRLLKSLT